MTTNTAQIIPLFTRNAQGESIQLCNARDLHAKLQVGKDFSNWIKDRIEQYGFIEDEDFYASTSKGEFFPDLVKTDCSPNLASKKGRGGHNRKDYHITLDMAKELAMIENNDQGRAIRKYFITVEKQARKLVQAHLPGYRAEETREVHAGGLTLEQQDAVKALHKTLVEAVPNDQRGALAVKLWSSVKKKFGVSYKDVPPADFASVLSLMSRVAIDGEYLPKPEAPNALHQIPTREQIFQEIIEESLGNLRLKVSVNKHHAIKVEHIAPNEIITTAAQIPELIASGGAIIPNAILPKIIEAVAARMR